MKLESEVKPKAKIGASSGLIGILDQLRKDFSSRSFPWEGDFKDLALGYLTFASVLHAGVDSVASPVGSFVMGSTSSGKTRFLETLCQLFPDEMIVNLTTASSRSLIYQCRDNPYCLNGKVIFVEEMAGLQDEEIQYILRTLVTKGKARHTTVQGGEVQVIDIIAGISLQSTGLKQDILREDTMNRMVLFKSDDSNEMTKKVIENIKKRYMEEDNVNENFSSYKDFFRKLKPYKVSIPYADKIQFKITSTENRRLAKIFMDLLATVALVHQSEREIDYTKGVLISDVEDFDILFDLVSKTQSSCLEEKLNRCELSVYKEVNKMQGKEFVTLDDLKNSKPGLVGGRFNGYGATSIKNAINTLRMQGFVQVSTINKKLHIKSSNTDLQNSWGVVGIET